jgi:hypothetical protein
MCGSAEMWKKILSRLENRDANILDGEDEKTTIFVTLSIFFAPYDFTKIFMSAILR